MKKGLKVIGALVGIGAICGVVYSIYAEKKIQKELQKEHGFCDEDEDYGFEEFNVDDLDLDSDDELEDCSEDDDFTGATGDFTEPESSDDESVNS